MKTHIGVVFVARISPLLLLLALLLPWLGCATTATRARIAAQYNFTTNNTTITIAKYIGDGDEVTIPSVINSLPVTHIGEKAFVSCDALSSVIIPDSVTKLGINAFASCHNLTSVTIGTGVKSIGGSAFCDCTSLTNITVDPNNHAYSSLGGVLFNKNQTTLIQYPCGNVGLYTIPDGVTSLGYAAFAWNPGLTRIIIDAGLVSIRDYAFFNCPNLTGVYFRGNAPSLGGANVLTAHPNGDNPATIYYLANTTGWGKTFGGRPTSVWTGELPQP